VPNLLLIEDDEDDYLITVDLLREAAETYHVQWERDAATGLAALKARGHDACLLDFRLGATTGLEVLKEAREAGVDTPIVLLTGQSDRETDLQAMAAGASDYLVKGSFDALSLERCIRYAIDRAASVRALAESERRTRSLMENAGDGILILRGDGSVDSWNPSASELFGIDDLRGFAVTVLFEGAGRDALARLLAAPEPGVATMLELEGRRRTGEPFPVEVTFSPWEAGDGHMWSALIRDVAERRGFEDRLAHQAFHDSLTGLGNRAGLHLKLRQALAAERAGEDAAGGERRAGVLFIDLDGFKRVNDSLGHDRGDEVLRQVGNRIRGQVRSGDTATRLGGDEFAVVLDGCDGPDAAIEVADRILRRLREPVVIDESVVQLSASIGIHTAAAGEADVVDMLRNADLALFAAKANGRDRCAVFEAVMQERLTRRVETERDLRRALEERQLVVHYQPVVDLDSGQVASVEALMRWNHPERGLLTPDEFIGVLEETGLIGDFARALHRQAFAQTKLWQAEGVAGGRLLLCVNVSPRELADEWYVDSVLTALADSGLTPHSLVVEVNETALVQHRTTAIERLEELRRAGVRIGLDDFGAGHSSLIHLHELPVQVMKIHGSFVRRLLDGPSPVPAMVAMGHDMGFVTIAEGVEDERVYRRLAELGCDYGQGYWMARPDDAAATSAFLAGPGVVLQPQSEESQG
jgi:diguanylate cyclase (GGDEF)-like protein/PAS domain S-box-containing protein